jgi:phosphocarrier protein FPr
MTGLVVVSHSRVLAEAAVAMAGEMLHGAQVRIEVAAGLDATTFGTDATAIAAALTAADDGTGVVVLMDLGSAVISAELALELVEPAVRDRTVLCPAPLVEGLVVAAVAAAGGASAAAVAAEAMEALAAKQTDLGPAGSGPVAEAPALPAGVSTTVTLTNRHGLHARPAARLVQVAGRYDARLTLRNLDTGAGPVPATSLSRVATLGALEGHRLEVSASGAQADAALAAVADLVARRFDETEPRPAPVAAVGAGPLPASPGIAIGPAVPVATVEPELPDRPARGPEVDRAELAAAIGTARTEIGRLRATMAHAVGEDEARIFDAHLALLEDLDAAARERVDGGASATAAWTSAVEGIAGEWEGLADPYLRTRAADVRAVGRQVALALSGVPSSVIDGDGVLLAADLTPAEVAALDTERIVGIVLAGGSPTGHAAILARSRGIPAVVAAGADVLATEPGTTVALDGTTGQLVLDPAAEVVARLRERQRTERASMQRALASASEPAVTTDGVSVLVGANLGSVEDAEEAARCGADLAGLVRTEFLYLDRTTPPTPAEQIEVYGALGTALGGRRLVLRTLDVGGDKPLSYAAGPVEANPFLGVRGLRLALAERTLLLDQLEAIAAVARQTPVSVMFPMVSTLAELAEVRELVDKAFGGARPDDFRIGIMVEVPAAALKAAAFAPDVDFFSIGTNDLTQYTLAAERGNPAVAALGDPLDPAVLQLVGSVATGAAGGPLVAVCGELAADPVAVPLLVALGVRELSVAPSSVPLVKEAVRRSQAVDAELVRRCLTASGPDEVRAILADLQT